LARTELTWVFTVFSGQARAAPRRAGQRVPGRDGDGRMLEAFTGPDLLDRCYRAAIDGRYLWHEFGDVHLLLPS
jgi:hypothetical protein